MPLNEDSLWSDIFSFGYISLATLRISIWQRCDWSTSVYKLRSTWGSMAEARTLDRASCSLFGFFCLFYLHTARKESEPWGQVHQTCSRSAPDSLVSPASQPYTNTKESFQIAMFAKKLKLEKECTTGMFKTEGLGAIKWRNVCLRLAQLRHPSIVVKYCQISPTGRRQNIFLSSTFYTCKNAFHQSSGRWLPETVRELLTLLKPLAFSPAFLYPEIFSCFLKPAKILSFFWRSFHSGLFSRHPVSLCLDTLSILAGLHLLAWFKVSRCLKSAHSHLDYSERSWNSHSPTSLKYRNT